MEKGVLELRQENSPPGRQGAINGLSTHQIWLGTYASSPGATLTIYGSCCCRPALVPTAVARRAQPLMHATGRHPSAAHHDAVAKSLPTRGGPYTYWRKHILTTWVHSPGRRGNALPKRRHAALA